MRPTRFLIVALLWIMSLLSMPSTSVQAAPAIKPLAQQSTICSNQQIPAGWAVVRAYSGGCSPYINYTIQYVTQPMQICSVNLSQTIPAGWAVTQAFSGSSCSSYLTMYITPVNGPMQICSVNISQTIPAAYVVTQSFSGTACSSYLTFYIQPTSGTSMYVCSAKSPPAGWYVAANYSSGGNCAGYTNQLIKKY